jgi:hypothetical protein
VRFQDDGLTDLGLLRTRPRLLDGVYRTLSDDRLARELVEQSTDPFEQHVIRWCLENRIPLVDLPPGRLHVVFYEDLVRDPAREIERLGRHLDIEFDAHVLGSVRKPSRTDFRERARAYERGDTAADAFISDWNESISPREIELGLAALAAFELDHLYGRSPYPLIDGAEAARATRARREASPTLHADDSHESVIELQEGIEIPSGG